MFGKKNQTMCNDSDKTTILGLFLITIHMKIKVRDKLRIPAAATRAKHVLSSETTSLA